MAKTLAVIPARGGSKGLPHKNLAKIHGMSLLEIVVKQIRQSGVASRIVVSTDDERIASEALRVGADVPFLRPEELARDESTTESVLKHAINVVEEVDGPYDYGLFATVTQPFRDPRTFARGVELLERTRDLESYFAGVVTHKNFWEETPRGPTRMAPWMAHYASRQSRRVSVREETGVACVSRAALWRSGSRIGDQVFIEIQHDWLIGLGIDIHTANDLVLARWCFAKWQRDKSMQKGASDS